MRPDLRLVPILALALAACATSALPRGVPLAAGNGLEHVRIEAFGLE
jgi:hypothetical protein